MSLQVFALCCIGAFALLQFHWIPRLRTRWETSRRISALSTAAMLSVAALLRTVAAIAGLTTLTMMAWVLLLRSGGGATVEEIAAALTRLELWQGRFAAFGPTWSTILILALVLSLAILTHRRTKRHYQNIFNTIFEREFERLDADRLAGRLEPLPPTSEMDALQQEIEQAREVYAALADETGAEAEENRKRVAQYVYERMRFRDVIDIARRIDAQLDEEDVKLPEAETAIEKLQSVFISRGFVKGLGFTGRALYLVTIALLVPSFAGFAAARTAPLLQQRMVELRDLRMNASRTAWQQATANLGSKEEQLSAEDQAAIDRIAEAYERQLSVASNISLPQSAYSVRAALVSNRVIATARAASKVEVRQYPSGSKADNLTEVERWLVGVEENALARDRGPITPDGKAVREDLSQAARRSATLRERIRTAAAGMAEPAASRDIAKTLVDTIAGSVAGEVPGLPGELLSGIEIQQRQSAAWARTAARRQFVSSFVGGTEIDDALRKVGFVSETISPRDLADLHMVTKAATESAAFDSLQEKISSRPPGIEAVLDPDVDWDRAAQNIVKIADMSGSRNAGQLTEFAATFATHFPNHEGAEAATPAAQLREFLGGDGPPPEGGGSPGGAGPGGGGGGPKSPQQIARVAETIRTSSADSWVPTRSTRAGIPGASAARSRSFGRLRGFARVGGVLIGQTMPAGKGLDIRDIAWTVGDGRVEIVLTDATGKRHRSVPHRATLVQQALTYAADGRPLAVTMTTAEPLPELKILVHPALVDTAMGHRVIELDRFVDTYARGGEPARRRVRDAEETVDADYALYQYAWAARLQSLELEKLSERVDDVESRLWLAALERLSSEILESEDVARRAARSWNSRSFERPDSLLRSKPEYFDPTLVSTLITTQASLSGLRDALARPSLESMTAVVSNESLQRYLTTPPEYQVWSGVREKAPAPRISDVLVMGKRSAAPLEFMLQVAFTSAPREDTEKAEEPWEFPGLGEEIDRLVLGAVMQDARAREVLRDSEEFTILQRLFRLALAGDLGSRFPVEKLASLANALAPYAPEVVATPRWNARPGIVEAMQQQAGTDEQRALVSSLIDLRRSLAVAKSEGAASAELPPIR